MTDPSPSRRTAPADPPAAPKVARRTVHRASNGISVVEDRFHGSVSYDLRDSSGRMVGDYIYLRLERAIAAAEAGGERGPACPPRPGSAGRAGR